MYIFLECLCNYPDLHFNEEMCVEKNSLKLMIAWLIVLFLAWEILANLSYEFHMRTEFGEGLSVQQINRKLFVFLCGFFFLVKVGFI